ASRSWTAMATWSISVSMPVTLRVPAEDVDPVLPDLRPELRIGDAQALLRRQAQDADLPLVQILVDLQRRLAGLLQRVDGGEDGLDLALADEAVGLPGLPVVGEVAALDGLEAHPQVPVVVLDHVARRGGAGDDRAAPAGHEDRGAHGVAAGVLEDDVGVAAGQLPDAAAEAAPLGRVLGALVLPETVALGLAVDDVLDAELVHELDLLRGGDHGHRGAAPVEDVLAGVAAEAAAGPPDEHDVTLGDRGAVGADQHAVAGRVGQGVAGRLLPRQVGGLGHQLVGLDHGEVGQAA